MNERMNYFSSLRECSENHCHFSIVFVSLRIELLTDGNERHVTLAQHHISCWIDNEILNVCAEYTLNIK
jgi:hypothetical protein